MRQRFFSALKAKSLESEEGEPGDFLIFFYFLFLKVASSYGILETVSENGRQMKNFFNNIISIMIAAAVIISCGLAGCC